ncbi:putative alternative oxidase [Phaeomoniella chlamydospora]|uniref:Putative alternative oxidase n=1 Tax=Phaeomoniella chlamydospora TaxID=158046 RepID=A0A0G2ESI1_PHACM|nr:putative alternative oxidase [Phaeomoniella chlamydospora]
MAKYTVDQGKLRAQYEMDALHAQQWVADMKAYLLEQEKPNIEPLRKLCSETEWIPNRVFQCDHSEGGIANIFVQVLECVRFAIMGGASVIIPKIAYRGTILAELSGHDAGGLEYLFDKDVFISSLQTACPQLGLYENRESIPNISADQTALNIEPRDLRLEMSYVGWRERFEATLKETMEAEKKEDPNAESHEITLVNITPYGHHLIFTYYIAEDNVDLQSTFSSILRFNEAIYEMSAWTLYGLSSFDPSLQPPSQDSGKSPLDFLKGLGLVGVHLRVEADAQAIHWPGYEVQTKDYFDRIDALREESLQDEGGSPVNTIYLATGNQAHRELFSHHAWVRNQYHVIDKSTVLSALSTESRNLTQEMENLTWDQQALIDMVVLSHGCRMVTGMVLSSYIWKVALHRHLTLNTAYGIDLPNFTTDQATFDDGLSYIPGAPGDAPWFRRSTWP